AYEQDLPINYCPSCKTGLANEEVLNDFTCERCGAKVEKKKIRQWVLAITKYADRLLEDLDGLDWSESLKEMQRNWIGKSEGCEFEMKKSDDEDLKISVYTTRIDTVFGMTYAVLAPDHSDVEKFITPEQKEICQKYIDEAKQKSDQDRTADNKEKTGVFTGSYVINPFNNEKVPLWIGDYVLGSYGTGAVMAVPAHDERDFAFAKKYNLEIKQSVADYVLFKGVDAPRKDVETLKRKTIDLIIENEKGEFLLLVEEHSNGRHIHLVGGGIEEGDSELETVKKELIEETGFTDFEIVKAVPLSYRYGFGYRANKNKNQACLGRVFYVKLTSDNQIKSEIDEGMHSIKWVKKEDVFNEMTWNLHQDLWNCFISEKPFTTLGKLVNSGEFSGLSSQEAQEKLTEFAEKNGFGGKKINYKLRDWLFSRQRYWGEPIPLIHLDTADVRKLPRIESLDEKMEENMAYVLKSEKTEKSDERTLCSKGKEKSLVINGKIISKIYTGINGDIVCDYNLPLELPQIDDYKPAGDGKSPLAKSDDFVNVKLAENLSGKRETNTMPQWGGSCWYYLRYLDPTNQENFADKEILDYWQNVDEYVGGTEHAVLHLLYARFWHKFLFDIGAVPTKEPFQKLVNQGMILAYAYQTQAGQLIPNDLVEEKDEKYFHVETGEELKKIVAKMSKSLKNTLNPLDIIEEYGADTLRLYEMSIGDFRDSAPWDSQAIVGVYRFLEKIYAMYTEGKNLAKDDMKAMKLLHKTIKKVEEDIKDYKFNTAITALIILSNEGLPQDAEFQQEWKEKFLVMLHPFAPHIAEELFSKMDNSSSIFDQKWPEYDEFMLVDDEVTIAVQINGKMRGTFTFLNGVAQEEVSETVCADPKIQKWLEGKEIVKEIFIPNKMLSIVVK
ncbi:class I tRNA ligase family protein, partial [Candidatus Gracilibacteria bacterium]|nr:class I tRNA ligase family protein [Candidatus Gracilibacteria bacterium]